MPPITNPFSALDGVTLPMLPNCTGSGLVAYSAATPCTNNGFTLKGNSNPVVLTGGVYFISGTLSMNGQTSISGTALFILLPGASFLLKGGASISITANPTSGPNVLTNAMLPTALQPDIGLLANMAMYDRETAANASLSLGGNSSLTFNGNIYAPDVAMTFQGNPTVNACGELIAKSLAFNGNATFDNSNCSSATKFIPQQYVALVQ